MKKTIKVKTALYTKPVKCPYCLGCRSVVHVVQERQLTGWVNRNHWDICPKCNGNGYI